MISDPEPHAAANPGLDDAYGLETPEDNIRLYRNWADSYEDEFMVNHGYVYHVRVVEAFAEIADRSDSPVLDVGCGTGVVGAELAARGPWAIDGLDISPEMLIKAAEKRNRVGEPVYGSLIEADLTQTLAIADDVYGAVVSSGTFTMGHVGPEALTELARIVRTGGLLVFGVNSEFYAERDFGDHLARLASQGLAAEEHRVEVPMYDRDDHEHAGSTAHVIALRVT
ncbi:MAG: methyltransferase domain-containing protein [Actinomycetota bacterium]